MNKRNVHVGFAWRQAASATSARGPLLRSRASHVLHEGVPMRSIQPKCFRYRENR